MKRLGVVGTVAAIFAIIGLLMVWVGMRANERQTRLEADAIPASATVIDKERTVTRNRNFSSSDPTRGPRDFVNFYLSMSFKPLAQDEIEVRGEVYEELFDQTQLGDRFDIVYSAADPATWDWAGVERSRGPASAAIYIGAFIFFVSLIVVAKQFGLLARRR
ncbi:MAG: DUF3592 domain-containing protein [Pseudomonadota bacterium]